jgi:hypothetical protein
MVHTIDTAFGQSLDDKNATTIVNAAWAMVDEANLQSC